MRRAGFIKYQKCCMQLAAYDLAIEHTIGIKPDIHMILVATTERAQVFAIQGRAFGKEQPKYLTLKLQENKQKIFGLERVNLHKRLYVVEGPLDSLFLDNCIAAGGADLQLPAENKDVVFIFDNEPRNKEIIDRMYKLIDKDYMIVIWPEGTKEKDINEMIIKGKTKEDLQKIISDNTYSGLSALTQLNSYKRI